jgi:Rrf2 family protein
MLVTRESDYAIRTVLYLALGDDRVATVAEVAGAMDIPRTFLSKIVQRLAKGELVESIRGVNGGFRLKRSPSDISLLEVVEAIQGIAAINACVAERKACGRCSICAVRPTWIELQRDVERKLRDRTIAGVLAG